MTDSRTLYLVLSGAPVVDGADALAQLFCDEGWQVSAYSTGMGTRFHDVDRILEITGSPVQTDFRMPGTGTRVEPADCVVACPLSFNSTNKFAQGIADNMAVALLCEMVGYGVPTVVVPKVNPPLNAHPAFQQSLTTLRSIPAVTLLHDPNMVGERRIPTWRAVVDAAHAAAAPTG